MVWSLKVHFPFLFIKICLLTHTAGENLTSRCPSDWDDLEEYEDHCYGFMNQTVNWSAAEVDCRRSGGNLVKIDDVKENDWIKKQVQRRWYGENPWIGLYKYGDDWRWVVDFQVPSFLEWPQPDGDGSCIQLSKTIKYNWNDISCNEQFHYICESNMSLSGCPSQWIVYEDHCYWFIKNDIDWFAAKDDCSIRGGYLVKIDDVKENNWMKMQAKSLLMEDPWIGLHKLGGNWQWHVDGQVPLFFGFEPSGDGKCSQLSYNTIQNQYNWNDIPCNTIHNYICERSGCSDWETFGSCSMTCGTGKQLYFRRCNNSVPGSREWYRKRDTVKYENCSLGGCPVFKWAFLKEMNLTKSELVAAMKKELNELQANLTVDTKNTSAAIRLRTSARDERPSAASVGYVAIVLLSIPFILMICCDCTKLFQTNGKKTTLKVAAENKG